MDKYPFVEGSESAELFEKVTGLRHHPMLEGLQRIHDAWAIEAVGNYSMFIYRFMNDTARLASTWDLTYEGCK
jgi:hypothetical protein